VAGQTEGESPCKKRTERLARALARQGHPSLALCSSRGSPPWASSSWVVAVLGSVGEFTRVSAVKHSVIRAPLVVVVRGGPVYRFLLVRVP
jgi:hypothetical protein